MKNLKLQTVMFIALAFAGAAQAAPIPELSKYLEERISAVEAAATLACKAETLTSAEPEEDWYLRNIWIRVRPQFGITVSGFTKFQIVPEIEMLVQRPFADGWKAYHPHTAL